MASSDLLKAIAATAEICGRVFSPTTAKVFADDLAEYPENEVMRALARCRKEVKGALTLADVLARLDDGRPGVEEAWAMIPKYEEDSVVWTKEMSAAYYAALPLMTTDQNVGARMAFKETYTKLVQEARAYKEPPNWTVSLGTDPNKRDRVVLEAVNKGRIPVEYARNFAPELPWDGEVPQLEHQSETKQKISALLEAVTKPVQAEEEQL